MLELLSFWPALGPVGRAITLGFLGLMVGSFLSVLRYRLPRRQDPWRGRSRCPTCGHNLGMMEMVPVLSYVVQGGRCRLCRVAISPIYPLLELGTGLLAAAGGLVSWTMGLAVLGALIGVTWIQGRTRVRRTAGGFMLVEVVVAFLLLAVSIGAVLDLFGIVRHAVPAGYRRTEAVALARAQYSIAAQGLNQTSKTATSYCHTNIPSEQTGEDVLGIADLSAYIVDVTIDAADNIQCTVVISVSCPTCPSRYGEALAPVTVRGYIRKKLKQSGV